MNGHGHGGLQKRGGLGGKFAVHGEHAACGQKGKVEVEELKGGKKQLVISEIPYTMIGSGISKFLNDVASLVETKKTTDIVDISNQSSKEGIRIVLELKRGADVENFMVLGEVCLPGETYTLDGKEKTVPAGRVVILGEGAAAELSFPASLTPSVTVKTLDDPRLTNVWGDTLRRISFTSSEDAPLSGQYLFSIRILK